MKLDGFGTYVNIPKSYVDPQKEALKNGSPFNELLSIFDSPSKKSKSEGELNVLTGEFEHDETFDSLMDVFTSYYDEPENDNEF